jgi:2-deoxy-D-gluconate 3-dehydrogenase
MFSLENKVALITGASGGIGRALAIGLAQAGAKIGIHGTKLENLEETKRQVEAAGGSGIILEADLSSVDACRGLISEAVRQLGGLDILINNAGMNRRKPIDEVTEDDWDTILKVNLKSAYFLSQEAKEHMAKSGGGKIIHIGSMTTCIGVGTVSVYGCTKSAIGQLAKSQAVEWAKYNIQANCIAPGFIKTPLTAEFQWGDPHRSKWILDRTPARRPGTPEDLVGAAIFLSAPASDFVTGVTIPVDGGFLSGGSWVVD